MTTIRPARMHDEAKLFDFVRAFPTPRPPDRIEFSATLRTKLADSSSFVSVTEREDILVGYVAGYRHATFYAAGETAWVDELLVDNRFAAWALAVS